MATYLTTDGGIFPNICGKTLPDRCSRRVGFRRWRRHSYLDDLAAWNSPLSPGRELIRLVFLDQPGFSGLDFVASIDRSADPDRNHKQHNCH